MSRTRTGRQLMEVMMGEDILEAEADQIVAESRGTENEWEPCRCPDEMGFIYLPGDEMDRFFTGRLAPAACEEAQETNMRSTMKAVLQTLSYKERAVLDFIFGLTAREPMTLLQAGDIMGVSRERIRQIEAKALRKLRHPSLLHKLEEVLPFNPR